MNNSDMASTLQSFNYKHSRSFERREKEPQKKSISTIYENAEHHNANNSHFSPQQQVNYQYQ